MSYEAIIGALSLAFVAGVGAYIRLRVAFQEGNAKMAAMESELRNKDAAADQVIEQNEYRMVFGQMQTLIDALTIRVDVVEKNNVTMQAKLLECEMDRMQARTMVAELEKTNKKMVTELERRMGIVERGTSI